MPITLRRSRTAVPAAGGVARAAVHEVLAVDPGAALAFCALLLARAEGPVLWIGSEPDAWPPGLMAFGLNPADLVLVRAQRPADGLWAFEEALRSPATAGALLMVRGAAPGRGPWPPVQVWHGDADPVVAPGNAAEIVKQWRDVHGLQERPTSERQVDGARHRAWCGRDGTALVESYLVPGLGHGAPVDPRAAEAERRCGAAAPGFPDAGISSTYHIARAWSLAGAAFTARAASR